MKLISKLFEPKRLQVIWQASDKSNNNPVGSRFVVGEIYKHGDQFKLKYFDKNKIKEALKLGFEGLTAYPYDSEKEYNGSLIDTLSTRLPPNSRADFKEYLGSFRISAEAQGITPLSLLAYTAGKVAGDGFSFAHTFEDVNPPFEFTFEIAGFRYSDGMKIDLESLLDQAVLLKDEPKNLFDSNAVSIYFGETNIGYVPKNLSSMLKNFRMKYNLSISVTKINGTKERPNVLLFVEVR
jgi:hypothetical protein